MSTEPEIKLDSADNSPYIRTFAKDLAAASGKNPASEKQKPAPKEKKKAPEPIPEPEPVIMPEPPKETAPVLPVQKPALERESAPETKPAPAVVEEVSDAERAAILARLKARVTAQKPQPSTPTAPPPAPTIPAAVPDSILVSIPPRQPIEKVEYREPLPIVAEVPPAPIPPPAPIAPPIIEEEPSPIHTYTSDFADHIDEKKASKFSVLAAEKDAHVRAPHAKKKFPLLPVLSGVLLLIIGTGGVIAAYLYMNSATPIVKIITPPTVIAPDSRVALTGSGADLIRAFAAQANQPLAANSVEQVYVNVATTTAQGTAEEPGSGGAFITALGLPAPDILLRNIDPSSLVGIVNAANETRPFFILRVTSYERTFAGMLNWETTMGRDLNTLYPHYSAAPSIATVAATSTSSTATATSTKKVATPVIVPTPSITNPTQPAGQFVDEVVANHDARALKDLSGRTLILYGYADKQTLIICRDEAAFTLLLGRLAVNSH